MNRISNKKRMTKVLMTATLCSTLIFSIAACNNESNGSANNLNDPPAVTDPNVPNTGDEPMVPDATQ